ncbi:MAG: helix-turn-helix domain-containing protein [Patescibacteria group bacterium]
MALMRKLTDLLEKTGLSESEVRFFVAILKNPHSTIYELAKIAGIQKDKAYKICESLKARKLITFIEDGKLKKPVCLSLNNFIENLNSQGRGFFKTAEKLSEIKSFLPMLKFENEGMDFEFFDHDQAGEKYFDLTYLNWNRIIGYGCLDAVIGAIDEEVDRQFIARRVRKGAEAFAVIANPVKYSFDLLENDYKEMRKSRVIMDKKVSDYFVAVVPEQKTFAIWKKQESGNVNGLIMRNSMLADLHENIFDFMYGQAKNFHNSAN